MADGATASVSRPLPRIEVSRPTAGRGIPEIRAHLDGPRCVFCHVPVGADETDMLTDFFGTLRAFPICKGHSEHPASVVLDADPDPESFAFCPGCGDPTPLRNSARDACTDCEPIDLRTQMNHRL
jgi:hypothetical protein